MAIVRRHRAFDQTQGVVAGAKACIAGKASRLHDTSSAKPTTQSGWVLARANKRSRAFFRLQELPASDPESQSLRTSTLSITPQQQPKQHFRVST
jgi:hypothetical protein